MFSKAIEMFITELALRGWLHTEDAKRRTVQVLLVLIPTLLHSHTYTFAPQRSDIAMAITKHDMFDFLIDIVPREEIQVKTKVGSKVRTLSSDPPVFLECHLLDLSPGRGSLSHVSFPLVTRQRVFHMFPSLSSPGIGSFTCFLPSRHQAEGLSHVSFPLVTRQRVFHMFPSLSSPGRGRDNAAVESRAPPGLLTATGPAAWR